MSVIIETTPMRFHKSAPFKCTWNASRHPAIFTFLRKDAFIGTYVNNAGKLRVVLPGAAAGPMFSSMVVGSRVSMCDVGNTYNKVATVTFIASLGTPDYIFDTDLNWVGIPGALGWCNFLDTVNYYVEVKVLGKPGTTGQEVEYGAARISVNALGYGRFDAAEYLNGYVYKVNGYKYDQRNATDPYVWGQYRLNYRERYVGSTVKPFINDVTIFYYVDATKYLKSEYGQNLADYVPIQFSVPATDRAKFLTDFPKPTYFQGLPFSLSCIFPVSLTSRTVGLTANEEQYDKAGVSLGPNDWALNIVKVEGVQRLALDATLTATPYPDFVGELDYWINCNDVPQETYFVDTYIDDAYYETLPLVPVAAEEVTERKRIKIATPCPDNLFFVAWRNSKGGWSYWAFQKTQEYNSAVKPGPMFGTEPDELVNAMEREVSTYIEHAMKVTVGAQVDAEDVEGLKFIESSPKVQLLLNPFDTVNAPSWLTLKINPKGTKYRSDSPKVDIEYEFYLPDYYTVPN